MTYEEAKAIALESARGRSRPDGPVLVPPETYRRYAELMSPLAALPNIEPHYAKSELKNAR